MMLWIRNSSEMFRASSSLEKELCRSGRKGCQTMIYDPMTGKASAIGVTICAVQNDYVCLAELDNDELRTNIERPLTPLCPPLVPSPLSARRSSTTPDRRSSRSGPVQRSSRHDRCLSSHAGRLFGPAPLVTHPARRSYRNTPRSSCPTTVIPRPSLVPPRLLLVTPCHLLFPSRPPLTLSPNCQ